MNAHWLHNLKQWEQEIQRKNKLDNIHFVDENDVKNYILSLHINEADKVMLLSNLGSVSIFRILEMTHVLLERSRPFALTQPASSSSHVFEPIGYDISEQWWRYDCK